MPPQLIEGTHLIRFLPIEKKKRKEKELELFYSLIPFIREAGSGSILHISTPCVLSSEGFLSFFTRRDRYGCASCQSTGKKSTQSFFCYCTFWPTLRDPSRVRKFPYRQALIYAPTISITVNHGDVELVYTSYLLRNFLQGINNALTSLELSLIC